MASIRERVSRRGETTFQVMFRIHGKQSSVTFEDRSAAERFASLASPDMLGPERALAELDAVDQADDRITLDELAERYFEWKTGTKVTERTLKDYRRDYHNWIAPTLGGRPAEAIDETDVQAWADKMTARGLSAKSVQDRHMILGSIYRFGSARSRRLVTHNPCGETQLPSKRKKAPKGFTLPQWMALHSWAAAHEPDAADLMLFLVATGWRFSEATPLTVAAVEDYGDVEHGDHVIPQVWVAVLGVHRRDAQDRSVFVEGEGKSDAATRRINLPPAAARMVRRRCAGKAPGDLVFVNRQGKQWRANNFNEREFQRALDGAGIAKAKGMGPHYFRHTQVGMLDRAEVSLAKIQRRIGHEDISTTLGVYGGMIDNSLTDEQLLALDAMMVPVVDGTPVLDGPVVAGEVVG